MGIELGGPGCKLFADLKGYFAKTVGITLHHKSGLVVPVGHEVLEADVFLKRIQNTPEALKGYQAIERWVEENGKADLLICSMGDGVDYGLSDDLFIFNLKRWYKMLAPHGTLLLSTPSTFEHSQELSKFLFEHENIFYSRLVPKSLSHNMVLRKLADAPESIDELVKEFTIA